MRLGVSCLLAALFATLPAGAAAQPLPIAAGEEVLVERDGSGHYGRRLVVALRAEPRTFNPAIAADAPSREVIGRMTGDLIHINRSTQLTEAALARGWTRSTDGREYTLTLRKGIRFSDGQPFDADDVVFTFRAMLDERTGAPQRDLLIVGGQPVRVTKVDAHTVRVALAQPYAAAERLFDSIAILPEHLLAGAYARGALAEAWPLTTSAGAIAGLGPYRLKEYTAGQRLVLERNPFYWKADAAKRRLPYMDEIVFLFAGTEDAQIIRFQSGESDILNRASADNFTALARNGSARHRLEDLGPGLEYNFLVFNQNDLSGKGLPQIESRQRWFGDLGFRRAVSRAVDRESIARLVYRGRAVPLWGNVSPGNRRWVNASIARPARSVSEARAILKTSGFSWRPDGALLDQQGQRVAFTIVTSSSNTQRTEMATLVQADLKELGMDVQVVPLEFRALVDRVFQTFDYDASILGLGGGDADPNSEMSVWLSTGSNHLWRLGQKTPATAWEAEVDRLMAQQLVTLDSRERKRLFDRVQELVAEQLPFIFLAAPHILVGARPDLGNFQPSVLDHYTLWNVDRLFIQPDGSQRR
ncbi:MAG TPA: ABC transporter substrate-binding protein [Vicinamibacterales bacterium]|nr:ABC transporter substrate-binding protein [Vicinamibacterales bacterium]